MDELIERLEKQSAGCSCPDCDLHRQAAAELRRVREAPVVAVVDSPVVPHLGVTHTPPEFIGRRARLVPIGEGEAS